MIIKFTSSQASSSRHHWSFEFGSFQWQGLLDTILCNKVFPMIYDMLVVFVDILVSITNKTDRYDITEMLLKMALNTHSIVLFWPWKYGNIKKEADHRILFFKNTNHNNERSMIHIVFCVAYFLNGDWFMQRGQTPMCAREIIYTPYFYLQKRNHVCSINEFSSKTRLSLIDRMTKHKN